MAAQNDISFERELRKLTFNSAPIINELRLLADRLRTQNRASEVVKALMARLERDAPNDRLVIWYMMDSILKLVKNEYIDLFAPYVPFWFIETFRAGNEETRRKLKHLLKTWEDVPVFSRHVLKPIHDSVGHGEFDPTKRQPPPNTGVPRENLAIDPYARKRPLDAPVPDYPPKRPREDPRHGAYPHIDPRYPPPHGNPIYPPHSGGYPPAGWHGMPPQLYPPPMPPASPPNPSDLLNTLNSLLQPEAAPLPLAPPAGPAALASSYERAKESAGPLPAAADDSINIIQLRKGDPVYYLYEDLPRPCRTCGLRCKNDDTLQQHLDWHFSMNQRDARRAKASVSQNWFMTVDEWVEYDEITAAQKLQQATPFQMNETEEVEQKVIHNVPVPEGDDAPTTCYMCHEPFEKIWDADSDSWMYRGVLEIDGRLVHQTCHELSLQSVDQPVKKPSPAATPTTPDVGKKKLAQFPEEVPELEPDEANAQVEYAYDDEEYYEEGEEGDGGE